MAKIGCFKHNDELYYVDFKLKFFQRDNKEVVMDIKNGRATIYDLGYIDFNKDGEPYYNSTAISSDEDLEEMYKNFIDIKSIIDRLKHIVKYESFENIEMFIKQDLSPVEQDVDELEIKITGPKYHLKNLCQLFDYINSIERTGGYLKFDLIYGAHAQKVKIDVMNKKYTTDLIKSYGNNSIDDGIIRIYDYETGKYKKEFLPSSESIKVDI